MTCHFLRDTTLRDMHAFDRNHTWGEKANITHTDTNACECAYKITHTHMNTQMSLHYFQPSMFPAADHAVACPWACAVSAF